MEKDTALSKITKVTDLAKVFVEGGVDELLAGVESEARSIIQDTSSAKGRGEIKSLAHKIAQGKVMLDTAGKDLVSDWKDKAKKVDVERKKIRDRLDALKKEVRQPLTEWEEAAAAVAAAEKLELEIVEAYELAVVEDELFDTRKELERKQREEEERERQRIKKEEGEKIRQEAEHKAREEAEAEAQQKIDEERAARERAEGEKAEAEQRAREERERAAKEKQAAVEEEKRKGREEAERREAERIRAEQRAREEEERQKEIQRKKAAKRAHIEKINSEAVDDLVKAGVGLGNAEKTIAKIADGDIRHVSINYIAGLED